MNTFLKWTDLLAIIVGLMLGWFVIYPWLEGKF